MPDARAAEANRLEVRRTINVPRERVFRAWTTPTSVQHWFATAEAPVRKVKLEPKVGGAFVIECDYQGGVWRLDGQVRELDAPKRFAFSWVSADIPAAVGSVVTVDFHDRNGATEIVLRQEGFPGAEKQRENESGWTELLGHVADLIAVQRTLRSVAQRIIPAPPEAVWRAWTTPELMVRFLSMQVENARVEADVRVGGRFLILMAEASGKTHPHEGEYLVVDPPRRLQFTWLSAWSPADVHPTVTIDLRPVDGGTEVTLVHEGQMDEPCRADHEVGWAEFLDMLIAAVKAGFVVAGVAKAAAAMKETRS